MIKFEVGNEQNMFLWHDTWHSKGPLLLAYGPTILFGSGLSVDAKFNSVIQNGQWIWPVARTKNQMELQSLCGMLSFSDSGAGSLGFLLI